MSTPALRIRRATPQDTPAILELLKVCFEDAPYLWSEAFWTWKHTDNPFGASPVLLAETAEGRLAGVRAFLRWQWRCAGQAVPAVRAVDTAVHPDFRGQGLFTRLTQHLAEEMQDEGTAFIFNTPNAQSRPGYLKMGWQQVAHYWRWARPVRLARCLAALRPDGAALPPQQPASAGLSPVEDLLTHPACADFLAHCSDETSRYATPLSVPYLRWRYHAIPGYTYRAAWDFDGREGAAALVRIDTTSRNLRVLTISELLISSTAAAWRMARALVKQLMRETAADYLIALPARRTPARRVLLSLGFVPMPGRGPHYTARVLNEHSCPRDPYQRANWHLGLGELEIF